MNIPEAPSVTRGVTESNSSSLGWQEPKEPQTQTLRDAVEKALANYFSQLDGEKISDVYKMVLSEVEAPLLEVTMRYTRDNQTQAANILGLNRGTLRKKLKENGML
jgi:Fis family transcriptional regulator